MTNIMIDITGNKPRRYNVNVCYYCQEDGKHKPKPILPEDKNAQRQPDGSMKCGTCVMAENSKMLSLFSSASAPAPYDTVPTGPPPKE